MEGRLSRAALALKPSQIQELSLLAQRSNAINLAEGFPDFPAPPELKQAAVDAINSDYNQYRHVQELCDYVARRAKEIHSIVVDPLTDIAICCGQTEAFAATIFATINHGDEVLLFDPAYETYETCIALAGGVPIYVELDPPMWTLDIKRFRESFTSRTKAVVLNSPHNPTGKVFTIDEMTAIAGACCDMDCLAITDEVYEHVTFDTEKHFSLATLPGMQNRTIITSSLSKTFSVTGWRIGWAIAPAVIASAIKNIHIKLTDSAPAPFQEAALTALRSPPGFFEALRTDYQKRRDYAVKMLAEVGFKVHFKPQGAFFIFAELPENCVLSDVEFVAKLIMRAGVAAVPGCGFFHTGSRICNGTHSESSSMRGSLESQRDLSYKKRYVRFAFCKSKATLDAAAGKMNELVNKEGCLNLD
ncbi:putative N-succinyldiaminopimelate aminotransferase [Nymphaea thermarum]|nr:putative N-succinyldiaminopimelate aminotransferase [Nymphaea thermarum]